MSELPYLIVLLLLAAIFLRLDFIFYIAYVCLGIYGWSRWGVPRIIARIAVRRHFHPRAFLGERVPVQITLHNQSRLPIPWLQLVESVPVNLYAGTPTRHTIRLGGRSKRTLTYHIKAMRRGYYQIGPLFFSAGDLFGFQQLKYNLPPDNLTVYPRILPIQQLDLPSRLPFGTLASQQRLFEDPARPNGVRNYLSGDSLRHINWKVSAHHESLLVKTFQPAISLETAVFLNLNQDEYSEHQRYDASEWAIVVAASLAAHLSDRRQSVGLAATGIDPLRQPQDARRPALFDAESGRLTLNTQSLLADQNIRQWLPLPNPPKPGRAQLMKVLATLARLEMAQTIPFSAWLPLASVNLSWGVTILAVTPRGDEATCQAMHRLVRAGYNPVLIVIEPDLQFSKVRQRAHRLGFAAYHVARRSDLDSWQGRVRQPAVGAAR